MISEFTIQYFKAFRDVRVSDLGQVNAFVGRNNAGKSSVLHALDLAGLAIRRNDWGTFPLKLKIEDLFWEHEDFAFDFATTTGHTVKISARNRRQPQVDIGNVPKEDFDTILILPDPGYNILNRRPVSPLDVYNRIVNRSFNDINALDILQAVHFYADKREHGLTPKDYDDLIQEVLTFFPELESVVSDRTEQLFATLQYKENGHVLDILYSGAGLKRFLDILIKVTLSQASIVLIDEPEFGMHPELQRRFLTFLNRLARERDLQFFMATHSPIFLNESADIEIFRVLNNKGNREIVHIPSEFRYTVFGDLGIRPSDLFQNDLCLMVEGQDDVAFFEFVIHELYAKEFAGLAVGVVQYGGKAAAGIVIGDLTVANVSGAQPYVHWVRDREARPQDSPDPDARAFVAALQAAGHSATLLKQREIEYYIPVAVYVEAQEGDPNKERIVQAVMSGDQSSKFRRALGQNGCKIPRGSNLRSLLRKHLSKGNLDSEIKHIVENVLLPWARAIRGT